MEIDATRAYAHFNVCPPSFNRLTTNAGTGINKNIKNNNANKPSIGLRKSM
jgi:hypothetical protein